jgi:ligand-binding sensor domain-containing protein
VVNICLRFILTASLIAFFGLPVEAAKLKGQAVTYADFSFVNSVAASMTHVYFATTEGIIRYNIFQDQWEDPLTGAEGLDNEDITRIWVDVFDKDLYAETSNGLYEYDSLFDKWFPTVELPTLDNSSVHMSPPQIMHPPIGFTYGADGLLVDRYNRQFYIHDILDDQSGVLWIGTWGYGPAKAGSTSRQIDLLPYGLLQNRVNALFKQDSLLWIGGSLYNSYRSGISVFDPTKNKFFYIESGLESDFPAVDINCLDGDDTCLYVGTPEGLFCLNKEMRGVTRNYSTRSGLSDDDVLSMKVVGDSIFVGTAGGLNVILSSKDSVGVVRPSQLFGEVIYDLELADSSLWIAGSSGAYRLKLPSGKLQKFQDPHAVLFGQVYDIERCGDNLWFASDDGLIRLNIKTGETEPFRLTNRKITPRALAVNDTIAAVASDKGMTVIFHKNKKQLIREFTTEDGLASNTVYSLLLDGDYIWIGTDKGLTKFLWNNPERVD